MKLKKLSLIIISLLLAICMAFSLVACGDNGTTENPDTSTTEPDTTPDNNQEEDGKGNNEEDDEDENGGTTNPVQLIAPIISLNGNVISWSAVQNANYYEVYENGNFVARNTATSYTVTKTAVGSYTYAVRAISASTSYTASDYSNTVTYKVEPKVEPAEPLATPVITLTDNQITWSAIDHATAYEIYENDVKIGQVTTPSYTVTRTIAGDYVYAIRAISSDTAHYSPSARSNSVTYTVQVRSLGFIVTVTVPSGYSAPVQVALSRDSEVVETKTVTIVGTQGSVEFNQSNEYTYKAAVVAVAAGYTATSVRLSASNMEGELKIIKLDGDEMFKLGVNSFRVANNDDAIGADQIYYFVADESGMYTIDATGESKGMYISVERSLYIDTASELNIATFRAEAGVPLEITVVGFEPGNFSFKIIEGEVQQDLRIGIGWGNRANYIFGDSTRTLEVSSPDYYVFEFGLASLANRLITLTIDGVDYVFGTWDGDDVENWLVIPLNKGTHEVTITATGINPGDEFGFCVLCIYQGEELKSVN